MGTTGANVIKTVDFDAVGYAEYLEFIAHTKQRNVQKRLDEMGSVKAHNRRQTLVMRRTKTEWASIAPDVDIAAYGEIHKLKRLTVKGKEKVNVTDNEIKAYKVLDPDFKATPTLETIADKVKVMIESGELSEEGNAEDPEVEGGAAKAEEE